MTLLAVSAMLLLAFLVIEARAAGPLMPLRIFRLRLVAVSNAVGLLLGGSFFGFIFIGTLYMQQVLHYSALQTGVAWLAATITSVALTGSFHWAFWVCGAIALLALPATATLLRRPAPPAGLRGTAAAPGAKETVTPNVGHLA